MVIYRLGLPYYKEFDNFQFVAHVPSRVLGTGTPNKKRSQKGKDFQKLKICDRRTLPALTNSRKPERRS